MCSFDNGTFCMTIITSAFELWISMCTDWCSVLHHTSKAFGSKLGLHLKSLLILTQSIDKSLLSTRNCFHCPHSHKSMYSFGVVYKFITLAIFSASINLSSVSILVPMQYLLWFIKIKTLSWVTSPIQGFVHIFDIGACQLAIVPSWTSTCKV
jgi:hypothetical protein